MTAVIISSLTERNFAHKATLYFGHLLSPSAKLAQNYCSFTKASTAHPPPRSFAISKFVPSPCLSFVFPLQDRIRVVLCVGCLHCCCHYSRKCHGCIPFNRRWTSSRSHDFDRTLSFLKIDPNPLYCILRAVFMNCGPLV